MIDKKELFEVLKKYNIKEEIFNNIKNYLSDTKDIIYEDIVVILKAFITDDKKVSDCLSDLLIEIVPSYSLLDIVDSVYQTDEETAYHTKTIIMKKILELGKEQVLFNDLVPIIDETFSDNIFKDYSLETFYRLLLKLRSDYVPNLKINEIKMEEKHCNTLEEEYLDKVKCIVYSREKIYEQLEKLNNGKSR